MVRNSIKFISSFKNLDSKQCRFCGKKVSSFNYSKHLKNKHTEELAKEKQNKENKQSKINFPEIFTNVKSNRLFALYSGTSTFPTSHVENKYFKVF